MRDFDLLNRGVCRQHDDPDLWHDEAREAQAVELCKRGGPGGTPCPGLAVCLDIGTDPDAESVTQSGVWGGMNAVWRGRIRASRRPPAAATQPADEETGRYQTVTFTAPDCRTHMQEFSL